MENGNSASLTRIPPTSAIETISLLLDNEEHKLGNNQIIALSVPNDDPPGVGGDKDRTQERVAQRRKTVNVRWAILALLCLSIGLDEFCIEGPASLMTHFQNWMPADDGNYTNTFESKFNMLYVAYYAPNVVLTLFGGALVSRFGDWQMLIVFSICMVIGEFIFAIGVHARIWSISILGRFIYGFGGENVFTGKSVLLARWFPDNQLALAYGLCTAFCHIGTVIGVSISPIIANATDLPTAISAGNVAATAVFFASLCIGWIEVCIERQARHNGTSEATLTESISALEKALLSDQISTERDPNKNNMIMSHGRHNDSLSQVTTSARRGESTNFSLSFWLLTGTAFFVLGCIYSYNFAASAILLERNYFMDPPTDCQLTFPNQCTSGLLAPMAGNPSFTHDTSEHCPGEYFADVLPSSLNMTRDNTQWDDEWDKDEYVFEEPLTDKDVNCVDKFWAESCTKNYCDGQDDASEKAGVMMGIPFFLCMICCPIFGAISDKYGINRQMIICPCAALIVAHLIVIFDHGPPTVPLVIVGLAYSMYDSVLWPTIALMMEDKYLGIANGIILASANASCVIFPLIAPMLYNIENSYLPNVELLFVAGASISLVLSFCIRFDDRKLSFAANIEEDFNDDISTSSSVVSGGGYLVSDEGYILQGRLS